MGATPNVAIDIQMLISKTLLRKESCQVMKLHQKSINIKLDENLSNEVFNYLQASPFSETKSLTNLLKLGLTVIDGTYHDRELKTLETRTSEIIRMLQLIDTHQTLLQNGLADINDAITNQKSDVDLLIKPTTIAAQNKKNKGI